LLVRLINREHEFLICYYPNGSGKGAVGLKLGIGCKWGVKQGNIQAKGQLSASLRGNQNPKKVGGCSITAGFKEKGFYSSYKLRRLE
jgi:hypothetical protein